MVWVNLILDVVSALVTDRCAVHKVVLAQESLGELINVLRPGAYHSLTKIDFKALDHVRHYRPDPSYTPHSYHSR